MHLLSQALAWGLKTENVPAACKRSASSFWALFSSMSSLPTHVWGRRACRHTETRKKTLLETEYAHTFSWIFRRKGHKNCFQGNSTTEELTFVEFPFVTATRARLPAPAMNLTAPRIGSLQIPLDPRVTRPQELRSFPAQPQLLQMTAVSGSAPVPSVGSGALGNQPRLQVCNFPCGRKDFKSGFDHCLL